MADLEKIREEIKTKYCASCPHKEYFENKEGKNAPSHMFDEKMDNLISNAIENFKQGIGISLEEIDQRIEELQEIRRKKLNG